MTTTPPEAPSGPPDGAAHEGPRTTRDEMRDLGRLRRSASDRKVAGVAGGLARHLDIDPLVLRVAFVVLAFFGGAGLILYGACWLLVPDEETDHATVTLDERSRTVALLVVGVLAVFALIGDSWGYFWFPWPLAIIALLVLIFLTRKDRHVPPPGSGGAPSGSPEYGSPAYGPAPYGPASDVPVHDEAAAGGDPATTTGTTTTTGYTGASVQGWQTGPVTQTPSYTPPPRWEQRPVVRDPRRRGPKLFWFTVALVTTALGLLGMADVAGLGVADSAYPALAVGVIGAMLLVGAVYGRAGGLILLGLLATIGMVGATAADNVESDPVRTTPTSAADVNDRYDVGLGEMVLDLSELRDPEGLDGRTIHLEAGAGRIEVVVPDDMDVVVDARVGGPGNVWLFGTQRDGWDFGWNQHFRNGDVATVTIDAEVGFGEIYVDEE